MEYFIADTTREDLGALTDKCSIDVDVGLENDYQIVIPLSEYNPEIHKVGNLFYALGTEYGGILHNPKVDTRAGTITFSGDTPRGMLSKKIIEPDFGKAYKTVNADIGLIAKQLLDLYSFGDYIQAAEDVIGSIVSVQYDRYTTILGGLTKGFEDNGYRLDIRAEYDESNKITWRIYTVPIMDHSEKIEFSQDNNVYFVIQKNTLKYNHMICGGKGELQNRVITHLYIDAKGNVSQTKTFTGIDERVYFYDYSSAESEEELIKSGKDKFKEINPDDTQEITIDDINVSIGDIVGGREYVTGISLKEKVSQKIYKYNYGVESVDYRIGSD